MRSARRAKYGSMLAILIGSGLALLASTQPWSVLHLVASAHHEGPVTVQGSTAAPALPALALAGFALLAALAIAGPVIRLVLAMLGIVLGGSIVLGAAIAAGDPVGSALSAITTATGVAGDAAVAALVRSVDAEGWPPAAIAGGGILVLGSLAVIGTGRRWPGASRRYQAARLEPEQSVTGQQVTEQPATEQQVTERRVTEPPAAAPTRPPEETARDAAIDSWDELSRGEDPTANP